MSVPSGSQPCPSCSATGKCKTCDGDGYFNYGGYGYCYACTECNQPGEDGYEWTGVRHDQQFMGDGRCCRCQGAGSFEVKNLLITIRLANAATPSYRLQEGTSHIQATLASGEVVERFPLNTSIQALREALQGTFPNPPCQIISVRLVSVDGLLLDNKFDQIRVQHHTDFEQMRDTAFGIDSLESAETLVSAEIEEMKHVIDAAKGFGLTTQVAEEKFAELESAWDRFTKPCRDIDSVQDEEVLLRYCKAAQVRWVRASYFFGLEANDLPLTRCQDIPPDSFCALEEVEEWLQKYYPLVVSYIWHTAAHPDPTSASLRQICEFVRKCDFYEGADRGQCPVIVDYTSLLQLPRTQKENDIFEKLQLPNINLLFRHDKTLVLRLGGEVPEDKRIENRTPYHKRGWCNMEHRISEMKKQRDLSVSFEEWQSKQRAHSFAVMPPDHFDKELEAMTFTCGHVDQKRVSALYRNTYNLHAGYSADIGQCPNGHDLGCLRANPYKEKLGFCSACSGQIIAGNMMLRCWACDFNFCEACMPGHQQSTLKERMRPYDEEAQIKANMAKQLFLGALSGEPDCFDARRVAINVSKVFLRKSATVD